MKYLKIIFLFLTTGLMASDKMDTIFVSFNKTVLLVFESEVVFDDIGTNKILLKREGNKVRLASAVKNAVETNLHIETKTGKLFSFILKYKENPNKILYKFYEEEIETIGKTPQENLYKEVDISSEVKKLKKSKTEKNELFTNSEKIEKMKNTMSGVGVVAKSFLFYLGDIYIKENKLYFKVCFENTSNIPYDIENIKFIIKGKKGKIKQAAVQESEILPEFTYNADKNRIGAKNTPEKNLVKVFVFEKFNFHSDKILSMEIWENGGERIFDLRITDKDILNVKYLNN